MKSKIIDTSDEWNRSGNYRKTNNFCCVEFGWPNPYHYLDTPEDDFKPENYPEVYHCAICAAEPTPYATTSIVELIENNARAQLVALNALSEMEAVN